MGVETDDPTDVLRPENRVAWCIVPFDAKKRGPAERAAMLKELGIRRCAYDWRDEHVSTFEQEIQEYKKNGIEFFAFWSVHEDAFKLFEQYAMHPQIWQTLPDPGSDVPEPAKVEAAANGMLPLAQRTAAMGCKLGLYNHGGWGGEPANMVAVCKRLHELGQTHVGIVYNFHHGHGHIDDWSESLSVMLPFLHCVNLNGMNREEQPKILGIGKGDHELKMIRVLVASGYDGPIGVLDHRDELDARESLLENLEGLDWVREEIIQPGSGGPKPKQFSSRIFPGAKAYRTPPITVEVRATVYHRDQYQILVASDSKQSSDHWELFSMPGTGELTAYLPGMTPDHVRSSAMISDAHPHTLAMQYEANRVRLYVDGEQVAEQSIQVKDDKHPIPGPLGIGRLLEGGMGRDFDIQWVRISRGTRLLPKDAEEAPQRDDHTIGYWNFSVHPEPVAELSTIANPDFAVTTPYDSELVESLVAQSQTQGDAVRGAAVFADARVACLSCHKIGEQGGSVGPDLAIVTKNRPLKEVVESVLWPQREVKPEFKSWQILLTSGAVVSGYKVSETDDSITLRNINTGESRQYSVEDIEDEVCGGSVMPDGLDRAMTRPQLVDLVKFLSELPGLEPTLPESIHRAIAEAQLRSKHSHEANEFVIDSAPLAAERWPHSTHPVNRDRIYDFYTKQAEHFRTQPTVATLIPQFPGLDGGNQGHWGNQNEETWRDDRWNHVTLGSVQAGVFHGDGITVPRGLCLQLGDNDELSTCFNPETLTYDAVWSGGFVKFNSVRHGFMDGMRMDGKAEKLEPMRQPAEPFEYHGFFRHGRRVVFSYRIGDTEYLDAPWVSDGKFVRDVAPMNEHSLRRLTQGGSPQWPEILKTPVLMGSGTPYAVDTIELPTDNPWKVPLFCGDHDFLDDGTAMVATMHGDVWSVTGLDSGTQATGVARWRRFASGLHHPLGLLVVDNEVYVQCRDQLLRLVDRNQDGEADEYECVSKALETSPAGHDFICGLQRDNEGRFYTASANQGLVRLSPDGEHAEVLATGFRNPDGLGMLSDGSVTVPVSEGEWTPTSAIHLVPKSRLASVGDSTLHFGYGGPKDNQPPELPLVYLPRGIDNSSGGQVQVPGDAFGPLNGQLLHFSFGTGSWFVVLRDEVDGQVQGAVVPMMGEFASGAHRGRFHPVDGQLYVSGMSGWGSYTPSDGCFERVRYTGESVQVPIGFRVFENGVRIRFSMPLDTAVSEDPMQHFAQCWNYRYGSGYGSPELSPTHPDIAGHDPLVIRSAHVLEDRRSLFLEIPDIQPVSQLHLRLHVNEDDTLTCSPSGTGHDLYVTVHRLDKPFDDFPGYRPQSKLVAVHPMTRDLAPTTRTTVNPWHAEIKNARSVKLETGKNLTFATDRITVKTNEPIALTLTNPDVVPHNWVLVRTGTLEQVGKLSNQMIADPDAFTRQYVPETDAVIAYTDITLPGTEQTIYFVAPSTPGNYPFLCTFPGHWMVMNGIMVVQ